MKKSGVKNLITFVLIAVSALVCFCGLGVVINNNFNTSEQYVDIGLNYEDGWYLINDAEDYYAMCEVGRTGSIPGAKFKLTQDITIDPRIGEMAVCKGITINGAGHSITTREDPTYDPDVLATANYLSMDSSHKWDYDNYVIANTSTGNGSYVTTYATEIYGHTLGGSDSIDNIVETYTTYTQTKYKLSTNATIDFSTTSAVPNWDYGTYKLNARVFAYGGLIGIAEQCYFEDIYINRTSTVKITHNIDKVGRICLGGMVGISVDCDFNRCVMRDSAGANWGIYDQSGNELYYSNTNGSSATFTAASGELVGHADPNTSFGHCLYIYEENEPYCDSVSGLADYWGGYHEASYCYWGLSPSFTSSDAGGNGEIANKNGFNGSNYIATNWDQFDNCTWVMIKDVNNGEIIQKCFVSKPQYIITADLGSGKINTYYTGWSNNKKSITPGSAIGALPGYPTRSGYRFDGWFTSGGTLLGKALTESDTSDYVPTGNMIIYARWTREYRVIAYPNGGTLVKGSGWTIVNSGSMYYQYKYIYGTGKTIGSLPPTPTPPDGYAFDNWNTKEDGSGSTVTSSYGVNDNLNIYAIWKVSRYEINIDLDGDGVPDNVDLPNGDKYDVESGLKLPESNQITAPGGYILDGFEIKGTNKDGTYKPGDVIEGITGNVTITPIWKAVEYTITLILDINEIGTGKIVNYSLTDTMPTYSNKVITYTVESVFNLPNKDQVVKAGYTFVQWKLKSKADDGGSWPEDVAENIADGAEIKERYGTVELEAVWKVNVYTIDLILDINEVGEGLIINYTLTDTMPTYSNETITYTIESEFKLPDVSQVIKNGYTFIKWKVKSKNNDGGSWPEKVDEYIAGGTEIKKRYGTIELEAVWETIIYNINFILDVDEEGVGEIVDYTLTDTMPTYSNKVITYTVESIFNLPNKDQVVKTGYTLVKWKINSKIDSGDSWTEKVGGYIALGAEIKERYGTIELEAVWQENQYTINLHSNTSDDIISSIKVKYTDSVAIYGLHSQLVVTDRKGNTQNPTYISWVLEYYRHVFVGWATQGHELTQTYEYITDNFIRENIDKKFDKSIMADGYSVSRLSSVDNDAIEIYAIWLPVYTVTLELNLPANLAPEAKDVSGVYNNGTLTTDQKIVVDNDYYHEYLLYTQLDTDIFIAPTVTGLRLHCYGHYIRGWIIKVGNAQYYIADNSSNPSYSDWTMTEDITKLVNSGVNMQYLQGYITAIPQWTPLAFDVRFVTQSTEQYKLGYAETKVSTVIFNSSYTMSINQNINITEKTKVVLATNILGYSLIYSHPYDDLNLNEDITLALNGIWGYRLQYKQYIGSAYTPSDNSIKWYIVIEGYYSPDIYRLKLDLQLPYAVDNDFKLNNNDYTLTNANLRDLQSIYSSKVLSSVNGEVAYVDSSNYVDRQGVIYQVDTSYYIYLQQDQIINSEYVYDCYLNGKATQDNSGLRLPNFEIAYYQMQYYYTMNNENCVNMYQIGELDEDHKNHAIEKISRLGARSITYNSNWKYEYCNTNEELNNNFALHVYWYRNIVNLEINNLLDNKDSFNGYTLIEEVEQITDTLQDHNIYHLIIYTLTEEVYEYTSYAFDDISLLKSTKYEYSKILELFDTKTAEELTSLGISKQSSNMLSIYFGNTFKVQAVDQSKDHSLDEFIGYRFDEYNYSSLNKYQEASTCTNITEFDNYVNNGLEYTVGINLQNYEHGKNGNTTNYVLDKDIINIDVHFTRINYLFNYQVTNAEYTLTSKYGTIKLEYNEDIIENYQIEYTVNLNKDNTLKANMQVRLGTELLSWDLVNDYNKWNLTEEDSQVSRITVTPTFLRDYLYISTNPKAYSSDANQKVGDVNAVCQDILFQIRVMVQDLSTDEIIREYILTDDESNTIFTIQGSNTVSIDNSYVIKMLNKRAEDEYVYYYQDDQQYVLRNMYLNPSLMHSTSQLTQRFGYPQTEFNDITLSVTHNLLNGSVNYIQFIEVSEENRYLNFYVEVAPTFEIEFKTQTNENDLFKGSRQVLLESVVIASANDGESLTIIRPKYLGYWGQETLFNFNAEENYYEMAKFNIDYEEENDTEFKISARSNVRYAVNYKAIVTIELVPQTYDIYVYVEYQGTRYSTNDEYGQNGEVPLPELVNASGVNIFDLEKGVVIKPDKDNVDTTKAVYYGGDKVNITYLLNSQISNDFIVAIYGNGIKIYLENGKYSVQFIDSDIEVKIEVRAKTDKVTITTNMPNHMVGEIYAQINNTTMITIQNASHTEEYTSIDLINGDRLTFYIKENIGYEFANSYEHNLTQNEVQVNEGTGSYAGYTTFTLFKEGFDLSQQGWYYLEFKQVPIEIEFKYYTIIPEIKEVYAGEGYVANSTDTIIQKGSEVILSKGNDKVGYRFEKYSYKSANGKELKLTQINSSEHSFTIDDEIMNYLSTTEQVGGKLILKIYVNYVSQYKYEYEYLCDAKDIEQKVVGSMKQELKEGEYYDYGTDMEVKINTVDSDHYKIKVVFDNGQTLEEISSDTIASVQLVEGSIKQTNIKNLSGFAIIRKLTSNYIIKIEIEAEKYDTNLIQTLNKTLVGKDEIGNIGLQSQGSQIFSIKENIYYEVEGSHRYGTEVKVNIYIIDATDEEGEYYELSGASLNGREVTADEEGKVEMLGKMAKKYSIRYILTGADLPTTIQLNTIFKALYYVRIV